MSKWGKASLLVLFSSILVVTLASMVVIPAASPVQAYYYYYVTIPAEVWKAWSTSAEIVRALGDAIILGKPAVEVGLTYDVNGDGVVNVEDAYLILKGAGLIAVEPVKLPPMFARLLATVLEALYGPYLERYPTLDGRIYLLYMLYYLPYK